MRRSGGANRSVGERVATVASIEIRAVPTPLLS